MNVDSLTVTGAELADWLQVHPNSIPRLAKSEGMPKAGRGRYPLKACIKWWLSRSQEQDNEDSSLVEARRLLLIAQRRRAEVETAKLREQLLDADAVATAINALIATIATQMDGLAPRMAAVLATIDDPAVIQRKLFDECRNIRASAARSVSDLGDALRRVANPEPAPEKKRRRMGGRKPRAAGGEPGAGAVAN